MSDKIDSLREMAIQYGGAVATAGERRRLHEAMHEAEHALRADLARQAQEIERLERRFREVEAEWVERFMQLERAASQWKATNAETMRTREFWAGRAETAEAEIERLRAVLEEINRIASDNHIGELSALRQIRALCQ